MINIADILKDCPKGTKLYSPICGDCTFEKIHLNTNIVVCVQNNTTITFNVYGQYFRYFDNAECLLFPSKENRDWNKFQKPFKDGDIISNDVYIAIFHKLGKPIFCEYNGVVYYHCWCRQNGKDFKFKNDFGIGRDTEYRFATDEEKQKLFDIIKTNGYKWNAETKTLEKLIIPKFKVGDKIKEKNERFPSTRTIDNYVEGIGYYTTIHDWVRIEDQDNWELVPTYKFKVGDIITNGKVTIKIGHIDGDYYYDITRNIASRLFIKFQDEWELAPNKFDISTLKAYDKVLVRDDNNSAWINTFFGFYDTVTTKKYPFIAGSVNWVQCIPYEGNERLLGKCDDCDEYYKNW